MRVLVVGTGLIGGSVAYALRASGDLVIGFDRDTANAERARELGATDEVADDPGRAAAGVDLVVVATPVGQVVEAVRSVAGGLDAGAVVTDVGSTKAPIVAEAEALLAGRHFVGGHPMAGTEGEGIDAARADLFAGALWILTPTASTDAAAFRTVNGVVGRLGARTLAIDPEAHDRLVALVSHLPYALATVLMGLAGDEGDERVFSAAAGSFRDVTRTAGSNPRVWRDILATNRDAVLRELGAFSERIGAFRDALEREDWPSVDAAIEAARAARSRFPLKGDRAPAQPVRLEVRVPDRAGVLAELTTGLGALGINIEDLRMDHTAAGGVVHLVVDGSEAAARAVTGLEGLGFAAIVIEGP